jgi:GntR family transcriptional repressor for pyruvate dehydrogenase complex
LQVADAIRREVVQGALVPGTRLPSVEALAAAFDVSISTMHAAIVALTFAGLLRTEQGAGTFVRGEGRDTDLPLALRRATRSELHNLRRDLELAASGRAARQRTDQDLHRLWVELSELRLALSNEQPGWIADADLAFHAALVQAAHNPVLTSVHRALGERLRQDLAGHAGRVRRDIPTLEHHSRILDALEGRRPAWISSSLAATLSAEADGSA